MTLILTPWLPGAPAERSRHLHSPLEAGLPTLGSESVAAWGCTSRSSVCRGPGPTVRPLLGSNHIRCRGKKAPHQMALPNPAWHQTAGGQAPAGLGGPPPSLLSSFCTEFPWSPALPALAQRPGALEPLTGSLEGDEHASVSREALGSSFDGAKNPGLGVPEQKAKELWALPGEDWWPPKDPGGTLPSSLQAGG